VSLVSDQGFQAPGDVENRLAYHLGQLAAR
jgi:hypothetical protein